MSAPHVSIIIVTFNNATDIGRCLSSVYAETGNADFEVIVVDNASSDDTCEVITRDFPSVRLVRRHTNAGFAAAVNQGTWDAAGRTFFILNPDSELLGDVLSPMREYLDAHPDIGLLAPKLLDADGTVQLSCRTFPNFGTALFNRYSVLTRLFPENTASRRYLMTDFDHTQVTDVDWVSGAAWLLPRSTLERVGPLDERYFWSIEDVDYCQRVHRAGLRVVYFPGVSLLHTIGGSSSSAPTRAIAARHRGMWRYYSKYMRPASLTGRLILDAAVVSGITARATGQLIGAGVRTALQSRSISTGT
jgi:GT2 family glycosyltransferase